MFLVYYCWNSYKKRKDSIVNKKKNTTTAIDIQSGGRINMVKSALRPFVEETVEDENTIIKLVLFNSSVECVDIPRNRTSAGSTVEKRVSASGGTDFESGTYL